MIIILFVHTILSIQLMCRVVLESFAHLLVHHALMLTYIIIIIRKISEVEEEDH